MLGMSFVTLFLCEVCIGSSFLYLLVKLEGQLLEDSSLGFIDLFWSYFVKAILSIVLYSVLGDLGRAQLCDFHS
jgi:hypothetical protein